MTRAVVSSGSASAMVKAIAAESLAFVELPLHSQIDRLTTPLWVFDIDRSRVIWANQTALEVWNAVTLAELTARDLAEDMSISVAKRLKQYRLFALFSGWI